MKQKKNEWDSRMMPKVETVSPSIDEGSSGGLVVGGGRILKKGPWTTAEDAILVDHVKKHGEGNWNAVQKHSGLYRCGKSCRLRWANHLRPNLKKGAITPEEERLIIELHSKMGNKWARMATHLPGRTDNEIKNYWNTRIKRRQRAGLSPYPSEMCFEAANENLQSEDDEFSSYVRRQNGFLVTDGVVDGSVFTRGFGSTTFSSTNPTGNHVKRLQGSETLLPGFHGSLPGGFPVKQLQGSETLLPGYHGSHPGGFPTLQQFSPGPTGMIPWSFGSTYSFDPDPGSKNLTPFSGSHALANGNFSTSRPFTGDVKLELPSLQYTETDVSSWFAYPSATSPDVIDTCIPFPPATVSDQSDCLNCVSPRNSGLLEALLHEACDLRTTRNHPSEKISSSVLTAGGMVETSEINSCEAGWGDYRDPITPLGLTAASVFCETPPISGISIDGFPPSNAQSGSYDFMANTEHVSTPSVGQIVAPTRPNFVRPDALLGPDCFDESYQGAKEHSMLSDATAPFLGDDLFDEDYNMPSGMASSAVSQELGLEPYQWNNMPHVFQMPEIP